jgi:hypothetical protein
VKKEGGVFHAYFFAKKFSKVAMSTISTLQSQIHSGDAAVAERIVPYNPEGGDAKKGKSVEYALLPDVKYWFPIRATHHRAQKIYDKIVSLRNDCLEPYLPLLRHIEYTNEDFNNPTQYIADKPLDTGLLFLRSTVNDFRALLQYDSMFPGMTPYYNHFAVNSFGKNEFLTVPERQMQSFKIIVESGNENILVDQHQVPEFVTGDSVVVIGGPFAGVEGVVMKYKHQKRVFVELQGVGRYATAYVPGAWIRRIEG